MKSPGALKDMHPAAALYWPLTRIVDGVEACEKRDTSLLQIADACAFIMRKKIEGHPEADAYFQDFADKVMGFRPAVHPHVVMTGKAWL